MGTCVICDHSSPLIARTLGLCLECIRSQPRKARRHALAVHTRIRSKWGLAGQPPRNPEGVLCPLCVNRCRIAPAEWGYCGLRQNLNGRLEGVSDRRGKLSWYLDRLPTNCVGDWVCPGGTGCGYPAYSYRDGPEYGYQNLVNAVTPATACICYFGGDPSPQLPCLLQSSKLARENNADRILSELLGRNVDLVTEASLKPHIGRQILKEVAML